MTPAQTPQDIERVAGGLSEAQREREAIISWLRDDAAEQRNDLCGLHARKLLTTKQTLEWETMITTKSGIADAIESGQFLTSSSEGRGL